MKLKITLLVAFIGLFTCSLSNAQNLVPNGDFELFDACPVTFSQIDSAAFWTVPTSYCSTDYFNTCAPLSSLVGVPVNQGTGYQQPHSGSGYAGLFLESNLQPNIREYIEVQLTSPLSANECYHFEMYVNILNGTGLTSDDIGVYFSDTLLSGITGYGVLPYTAQINNATGNLFDTLSWVKVQGDYTASGGEQFITIGNFKDDANTTLVSFYSLGLQAVYTYIDDVSLTVCTGINEMADQPEIAVGTDVSQHQVSININKNESAEVMLYDISSRLLQSKGFTYSTVLDISGLSDGVYIYSIRTKSGRIKSGKLIRQ